MGFSLFNSKKQVTNVEETYNKALNAAAEDQGFAFAVEEGGVVNVVEPGSVEKSIDFAKQSVDEVTDAYKSFVSGSYNALKANEAIASAAVQSSNSAVAKALGSLSETAKSTEEKGLDAIVAIFGIVAAAVAVSMVGPKLFKVAK